MPKDGNNNPVCETAKETQMYRTVFLDSVGKGESGMIWEKNKINKNKKYIIKYCLSDNL